MCDEDFAVVVRRRLRMPVANVQPLGLALQIRSQSSAAGGVD